MSWQEISVFGLVILAVIFLVNYFYQQTKSHNCDDCSLMEMKKKGAFNKLKK